MKIITSVPRMVEPSKGSGMSRKETAAVLLLAALLVAGLVLCAVALLA